jgi:hypothetical protein
MTARRIYVASSWRNAIQPDVVSALRAEGHEVYDFRNPAPDNNGFGWRQVDGDAANWTPRRFAQLVTSHPVAAAGFALDKAALDWCDTCVLVLPSGRSAHLEAGYACGQGKHVFVLLQEDKFEPELMYLLADGIGCSIGDMLVHFRYADDRCKPSLGWNDVKPRAAP